MRRVTVGLILLLVAGIASAQTSFYLDRSGTLWRAFSGREGLTFTGEKDGTVVAEGVVPFVIGLAGTTDTAIQVVADDVSEVMLAVWSNGSWERVTSLASDLAAHPRNPQIKLTQVSSKVADGDATTTITDSFLHVVWWEGEGQQHGRYDLLRLTAPVDDDTALAVYNLDDLVGLVGLGLNCSAEAPVGVLEHPLFASFQAKDHAVLLFGSQRSCLMQVLDISFTLEPPQQDLGITVGMERGRHIPIFGVRRMYVLPRGMELSDARVVIGSDLNPVVYRLHDTTIDYIVAVDDGWSEPRSLTVSDKLTIDQAIPLVENLAR
jgi:hypothetical protein